MTERNGASAPSSASDQPGIGAGRRISRTNVQRARDRHDRDQRRHGRAPRPRPGRSGLRGSGRRPRPAQPAADDRVVEQGDVERHRQQVEEAVVAGGRDQRLQQAEQRAAGRPRGPEARRYEDDERHGELDEEHHPDRGGAEPVRGVVRVPAQPGREGLRLVVVAERGQAPPRLVAAQQLGDPGQESQLERQAPDQPARRGARRTPGLQRRPPAPRRVEHGQHAGLQQQQVPLEEQEVLTGDRERQVQAPQRREDRDRGDAGQRGRGQRDPEPAQPRQQRVARPDPEQGRKPRVGLGAPQVRTPVRGSPRREAGRPIRSDRGAAARARRTPRSRRRRAGAGTARGRGRTGAGRRTGRGRRAPARHIVR